MTDNELNEAVGYIAGWRKSPDGKKWKSNYARAYFTYRLVRPDGSDDLTNAMPWYLERLDLVTHTIRGLPNELQWAFFTKLTELSDAKSPACIAPTKVWCEALVAVAYHVDHT
jgi:hypothetical protein